MSGTGRRGVAPLIGLLAVAVAIAAGSAIVGSIVLAKRTARAAGLEAAATAERLRRNDLLAGCERARTRDLELAAAWRDDADDWETAAGARRRDGDLAVAREYATNVAQRRARARRAELRAAIPCALRYPAH